MKRLFILCLAAITCSTAGLPALAAETKVAVAANFTDAAKEIAQAFTAETGHQAVLSFGSTGQLFTQISQGAPFEIFLAADQLRPEKAEQDGFAVAGSRFTYAVGKLILWSKAAGFVSSPDILSSGAYEKLAIANPKTAPYGAAAVEVLMALNAYDAVQGRLVQGNNIAQTYQFVESGNAELGFVARSQIVGHKEGSQWAVPDELYTAIRQDAVLLQSGANNDAARAFLEFLKSPAAKAVIEKYGYGSEKNQ